MFVFIVSYVYICIILLRNSIPVLVQTPSRQNSDHQQAFKNCYFLWLQGYLTTKKLKHTYENY
jgi:hypothetical protein